MKDLQDYHYTQGQIDFALTIDFINGELHTELNLLLEQFRSNNERT